MYYFNFYDLQVNSLDQIPAIFVLTVGITLRYNKFNNLSDFRKKCSGLLDVPSILFRRKLVRKTYNREFEVLYRTNLPQSYFTNPQFLFINYPINKKIQYLKLLSYRKINEPNNWIPSDYIDNIDSLKDNWLLSIKDNKIYFNYEGKH